MIFLHVVLIMFVRRRKERSGSEDREKSSEKYRKYDCRHPNARRNGRDETRHRDHSESDSQSGSSEWHQEQVSPRRDKRSRSSDDRAEDEKERKLKSRLSRVLSWL